MTVSKVFLAVFLIEGGKQFATILSKFKLLEIHENCSNGKKICKEIGWQKSIQLQGLRKWCFFKFGSDGQKLKVKFGLKGVLELWDVDIFDTTIGFYWSDVECHLLTNL